MRLLRNRSAIRLKENITPTNAATSICHNSAPEPGSVYALNPLGIRSRLANSMTLQGKFLIGGLYNVLLKKYRTEPKVLNSVIRLKQGPVRSLTIRYLSTGLPS